MGLGWFPLLFESIPETHTHYSILYSWQSWHLSRNTKDRRGKNFCFDGQMSLPRYIPSFPSTDFHHPFINSVSFPASSSPQSFLDTSKSNKKHVPTPSNKFYSCNCVLNGNLLSNQKEKFSATSDRETSIRFNQSIACYSEKFVSFFHQSRGKKNEKRRNYESATSSSSSQNNLDRDVHLPQFSRLSLSCP